MPIKNTPTEHVHTIFNSFLYNNLDKCDNGTCKITDIIMLNHLNIKI